MSEIKQPTALESRIVERIRLLVTPEGEKARKVGAFAIVETEGIYLGKGIEVGYISGNEAMNRLDGRPVRVERLDRQGPLVIYPDGGQLRDYNLPEELPGPEAAGVDDAGEGR